MVAEPPGFEMVAEPLVFHRIFHGANPGLGDKKERVRGAGNMEFRLEGL